MNARIALADLHSPEDLGAVLEMIDHYASQPTGRGESLPSTTFMQLRSELPKQENARILLAKDGTRPIGIAVCFLGFSTFRAKPILNIHDLAVHVDFQGQGLGRQLLHEVRELAKREGCASVTLEVRVDNVRARRLYEAFGFGKLGEPIPDNAELFGRLELE